MAKEFARQFYSSKTWQDCRNEYAKRKAYLCEECLRRGIYKPGVIVHHVEELTPLNISRPEVALNFNNLELLCRDCHNDVHDIHNRWSAVNARKKNAKEKKRRYVIDKNGRVKSK